MLPRLALNFRIQAILLPKSECWDYKAGHQVLGQLVFGFITIILLAFSFLLLRLRFLLVTGMSLSITEIVHLLTTSEGPMSLSG